VWFLDLGHFKVFLARTAFRANPVWGNIVPFGARGDAFFRQSSGFIVYPTANQANPSIHSDLLPEKKLQRVDNTEFDSRLQRLSVFLGFSMTQTVPLVLTFSASDPTAGAGLQADVLTIAALGAHPLTVLTGLTAQNTVGVKRFEPCGPEWIEDQLQALLEDGIVPSAIKTGVLGSVAAVAAVLKARQLWPNVPLVVDPVRASGRGDSFGGQALFDCFRNELFPIVDLLTPNWPEAQAFTGADTVDEAGVRLLQMGCKAVLLKGEHLDETGEVVNRLYVQGRGVVEFPCERLPAQYHGSGCTLASACAVGLGQGLSVDDAVELGLEYTWQSLSYGFAVGRGQLIPDRMHLMQHLGEEEADDEHA
jgi:hydroxymethylpyrimidine/phosphomethylpyrimidine kinase